MLSGTVVTSDEGVARLDEIGLENFAPYLMNRIMGRYNASVQDEMATLGLTTPQMRSLAVLATNDGILIRELSVYTVVPQSTLSRALDSLERDGLIYRQADETDNRATRIFLNDKGREAYERLWPHMAQSYAAMFAGIDEKRKQMFLDTLQTMLQNVRKHNF